MTLKIFVCSDCDPFVELTCGQPPEVSHAMVRTTGSRYMDKATYTCATGYQSDGQQHVLVCTKNATWEGDKITCTGNDGTCNSHSLRSVVFLKLLIVFTTDVMNASNLILTVVKHVLLYNNNTLAKLHT